MADYPAMPLWTDAYLGDTKHLTPAEHGAYLLLLMVAWRTKDKSLPNDDKFLGRCINDPKNWHRYKSAVMAFWDLGSDGRWRQGRLLREADYVSRRADIARESANARWRKNKETGDANASSRHMHPHPHPLKNADEGQQAWRAAYQWLETTLNLSTPLNGSRIHAWLESGADLELDIKPTITRLLGKRGAQGPPSSLNYFDRAISESINSRLKPLPSGDTYGKPTIKHSPDKASVRGGIARAFAKRNYTGDGEPEAGGPQDCSGKTGTDP